MAAQSDSPSTFKAARARRDTVISRVRRDQIEKAAMRSVLKHGFSGSSLRVVAKEARVPLSIVHYYFRDKDDLMRRAAQRIFDGTLESLERARAQVRDPRKRVNALIETYVMQTTENWEAMLAFIEYWAACVRKGTVDRFYTQVNLRLRGLLAESLREAGAENADDSALALLAMMVGYATFYRSKPIDTAERARFMRFSRAMVDREIARSRSRLRVVPGRRGAQ